MKAVAKVVEGKVWLLGDDINAESILMSGEEEHWDRVVQHVLEFYDPEFAKKVEPGDVIVAGRNFGASSGRPAAQILKKCGVGAIVCDSAGPLFYRNTWNIGLPVLQCQGVRDKFQKGDRIRVDVFSGSMENLRTGEVLKAEATPSILLEILGSGGLIEWIKKRRHLYPQLS